MIRLDRLVGRTIHTRDGRRVGRLEEFKAQRRDDAWIVTEYVIGVAGLIERLGLGARAVVGQRHAHGYIARWDQVDISDPDRPRLRCPVDELEPIV